MENAALRELVLEALQQGHGILLDDLVSLCPAPGPSVVAHEEPTVVDTQALADALASRAGIDPGKARMRLAFLKRGIRDSLLAGRRVSLLDMFDLRLVAGETRVQVESSGRQRVVSAGGLAIGCEPRPRTRAGLGHRQILLEPEPAFAGELARQQRPVILAVLPERDFLSDTLEYHFNRRGWLVQVSSCAEEAAAAMEASPVSMVVCDVRVPGAQELARATKSHPDAGPVSLLTLHPGSYQETGASPAGGDGTGTGFRVLGDARLEQPFEVGDLLQAATEELARGDRRGTDLRTIARMQVVTSPAAIDDACLFVCDLFGRTGIGADGLVAVSAAFREAIANAARHGNCGQVEKFIELRYTLTSYAITITVIDQGSGFDHQRALAEARSPLALDEIRQRIREGNIGGLGVMMMTRCVDDVAYSPRGNEVTLVKRIGTA